MPHASNPADKQLLVLINPASRSGGDRADQLDAGVSQLREAGWSVEVRETCGPEDAAASIHGARVDIVAIGGGDGTVSGCARALVERGLPFAVLPMGTANDLARSLGIESLEQSFKAIRDGRKTRIDLAQIGDEYFFNVANLGLGVQVTEALTPDVKRRWGVFSYLKAVSEALTRRNQFKVRLEIDGRKFRLRSMQLAVGNGRFYGGGNVVHEEATISDSRLHLYSLKPQGLLELLSLAPFIRLGQHRVSQRIFTESGAEVHIETSPPGMAVHADGEPVAKTPVSIRVVAGVIEAVVPSSASM
ncbi:lipid kinase [Microbulbifer sp. HZ11]|uniref:lipid kinase n=1 Tax=Microbulbifer sp. HZ11 TaxID=1453501 RepID=UPI0005BD9E64|nr:lipid kinase [Microbulbifer sp. HZ11]